MKKATNVCKVPVSATYRIINGEPVMISAEYADIPADVIARYIIEKCGITPVLKGGGSEQ